ncbi:MAG TPA: hypothetical protein GX723_09805 [Thermoanaerobacterales bacterium]|nr:hypothetical protein [Thermoanaerobacterales bacterium]
MTRGIRIQPRDKEVINDVIKFNGLPASVIISKHFKTKTYGYERLKLLENNGYLGNMYYYALRKKDGKKFAQRISAIYYATSKGCKEVGCTIDYRYVVPNKDKLDVANLVGNLYSKIPNLLSKRQAMDIYALKNFMPVTCVVPGEKPIFIYILGNKLGRKEVGSVKNFIESNTFSGATHYVVSRDFKERLNILNANYIQWATALEYLPNIAKDKNYYLDEFLRLIKRQLPGIRPLTEPNPLIRAQYKNQILHIGEFITGSNNLRHILDEPPENTIIYATSRNHFHGLKLKNKEDSFIFYSKKDKSFFRMILNKNNRTQSMIMT